MKPSSAIAFASKTFGHRAFVCALTGEDFVVVTAIAVTAADRKRSRFVIICYSISATCVTNVTRERLCKKRSTRSSRNYSTDAIDLKRTSPGHQGSTVQDDDSLSSSWPDLFRPSTSLMLFGFQDVDARDKRGHDEFSRKRVHRAGYVRISYTHARFVHGYLLSAQTMRHPSAWACRQHAPGRTPSARGCPA